MSGIGLWKLENLKTTILWVVSFAFLEIFDINSISKQKDYFKAKIIELVAFSGLVSFTAELFDLSISTEIVLIPLMTFLSILYYSSKSNIKYSHVEKLLRIIIALITLIFLFYRLYYVLADIEKYATTANLIEFLLPIVMSVSFLPFIFLLHIFVRYEAIFLGIKSKIKDKKLVKLALFKVLKTFKFNLDFVHRWARLIHLSDINNKEDILNSISQIKQVRKRETQTLIVPADLGWTPHLARNFLEEFNLKTRDYHWQPDDIWFASTDPLDLDTGDSFLHNNISYYIEGGEQIVTRVKLHLNIYDVKYAESSEEIFVKMMKLLVKKTVGEYSVADLYSISNFENKREYIIDGKKLICSKQQWTGSIKTGYTLVFEIAFI
ncbi:hypothetical protein [Dyadobacter sandarakinus]|uniref:Uncharacterized protein n=1 Tax=Dyadobacter sandarakinus TaxID=2747268 RepID=A0ABX7I7Y6_9BACT|nr:hypothetical protein [Dyadobacter sandarakinus]QRR02199.1 hypothetical protein HWI92_15455 [Dyadobacter sandarakinus]